MTRPPAPMASLPSGPRLPQGLLWRCNQRHTPENSHLSSHDDPSIQFTPSGRRCEKLRRIGGEHSLSPETSSPSRRAPCVWLHFEFPCRRTRCFCQIITWNHGPSGGCRPLSRRSMSPLSSSRILLVLANETCDVCQASRTPNWTDSTETMGESRPGRTIASPDLPLQL
ncbi:hypothetical protein BS50DRAFT_180787 [Corynespora cassiicola Philippines]|uniref:Uncharacterized protein n=1 Tax=Corynespora cassiicola Philippines TaxID=1448308 RepID=A0A2T2P652_CORCC|nr:hypothetical protein BS50DRAFT_180787 [Corynespora cassiicola Philippines]